MFSVTNTGTNFLPLCTAKVSPTISGRMVERRDQVLSTRRSLLATALSTFFIKWPSTNGPFFNDLGMSYSYFWPRRLMISREEAFFLSRVLYPLAGMPHGDTG